MKKSYKYRIYPNKEQQEKISQFFGCSRKMYNLLLDWWVSAYKEYKTLLGFGASAVNPYLAHATIAQLVEDGSIDKDYYAAVNDYDNAVIQGIVKIASKMGISTIQSYQGSKIFEAIGISKEVIDKYFTGTVSRIGGITLECIAENSDRQHSKAFDPLGLTKDMTLNSMGRHKMRADGGLEVIKN